MDRGVQSGPVARRSKPAHCSQHQRDRSRNAQQGKNMADVDEREEPGDVRVEEPGQCDGL